MRPKWVLLALVLALTGVSAAPPGLVVSPPNPVAGDVVTVAGKGPLTFEVRGVSETLVHPKKTSVTFVQPETGSVVVMAAGTLPASSLNNVAVVVVGGGGVNPNPGPNPQPTDPLTLALQSAFTADPAPDKRERVRIFAECMDEAAVLAVDAKYLTAGDLEAAVRKNSVSRVGAGQLPAMGKVVGEYLSAILPADKDAALTPATRQKASDGYKAVATAIKGVK